MMYEFDLVRPNTLSHAISALGEDDAQALGGGQTLIPTMKQRLAMPDTLVSLTAIPELNGICMSDEGLLCVGGASSHAAVALGATAYPGLVGLVGQIGDPAVRSRGTIGGSLANNDPAACYPAAALASGATIVTDTREISADDFFQGLFETALDDNEIIVEVRFPIPQVSHYEKFVQPASRYALVGVMVAKFSDGVRVAVTGASEDGVYRWTDAEAVLNENFAAESLADLTIEPDEMMSDIHGSNEYRAHLVNVMTQRAVRSAV